ncbi:hypothetical protein SCHPADRAFT_999856 [Schizopora paradoxa]|uniref:Chromatin elongation factor SPT5 n=1 Tax=Schizopora paradoxa TaxID=27342 RepID=A0A0H2RDT8_9AGAM|nr:hypothetical protein SCHPADRAFT_999856 [Schizopora paradoxa]
MVPFSSVGDHARDMEEDDDDDDEVGDVEEDNVSVDEDSELEAEKYDGVEDFLLEPQTMLFRRMDNNSNPESYTTEITLEYRQAKKNAALYRYLESSRTPRIPPALSTMPIFAIKTKIGRQRDVFWFATERWQAIWLGNRKPDVLSVFEVPNSPGWVYVEAKSVETIQNLFDGCIYVSLTSLNLHQRVANIHPSLFKVILSPPRPLGIEAHAWIKVLGGLYHGDIGQVRSVDEDLGIVDVAVVPRLAPAARQKPTKRLRMQKRRPLPRRIQHEDAIEGYSGADIAKTVENGFEMRGHFYEESGFRIVSLSINALEPATPTMLEISNFLDAATERIIREHTDSTTYTDEDVWRVGHIDIHKLSIQCFLKVGDAVEIIGGRRRGMGGYISRTLEEGKVMVALETGYENQPSIVEYEEHVHLVRAVFRRGQSITVKLGAFAGRTGIVEKVLQNGSLVFREAHTLDDLSVPSCFVETSPCDMVMRSHLSTANGSVIAVPGIPAVLDIVDKLAYKYSDKIVYVWKGEKRGKIGRVLAIGSSRAQICVNGKSVLSVKRENLMSPILETLKDGKLPERFRDEIQQKQLKLLINRLIYGVSGPSQLTPSEPALVALPALEIPPSLPPPSPSGQIQRDTDQVSDLNAHTEKMQESVAYDTNPDLPMMWLFDPKIAILRKQYKILVKFSPTVKPISLQKRTAKITKAAEPKMFPLDPSMRPTIEVEYTDNRAIPRCHQMPIENFTISSPQNGGQLLVIYGEMKGTIVRHVKTIHDLVYVKLCSGGSAFKVPKTSVCPVED